MQQVLIKCNLHKHSQSLYHLTWARQDKTTSGDVKLQKLLETPNKYWRSSRRRSFTNSLTYSKVDVPLLAELWYHVNCSETSISTFHLLKLTITFGLVLLLFVLSICASLTKHADSDLSIIWKGNVGSLALSSLIMCYE